MATRSTSTSVHAHGCMTCRARFEDGCSQPNEPRECRTCKGGVPWAVLVANRLPRDCCQLHSRLATKEELKSYRLSTACDWFRCSICARTFPYSNPTRSPV